MLQLVYYFVRFSYFWFSLFMRFFSLVIICVFIAACSDKGTDAEEFNAAKVCPESKRGTFVDERDGQVYKYTTIGDQVWMAQNLNYAMKNGSEDWRTSYCETEQIDCNLLGLVYRLDFIDLACPAGWHLPSNNDWNELFESVGGLKAKRGWKVLNEGENPNGTDDCGFEAYPATVSSRKYDGYQADFLSSSLDDAGHQMIIVITSYYDKVSKLSAGSADYIRCIKN